MTTQLPTRDQRLLSTDKADVWATEFVKQFLGKQVVYKSDDPATMLDESDLLPWFAWLALAAEQAARERILQCDEEDPAFDVDASEAGDHWRISLYDGHGFCVSPMMMAKFMYAREQKWPFVWIRDIFGMRTNVKIVDVSAVHESTTDGRKRYDRWNEFIQKENTDPFEG